MPSCWPDARAQMMLDPHVINLNTGSFGPLPRPVFEHATELRRHLAAEPMDFFVRFAPPLLWQARQRLASFLGGSPERLVCTANVTAAINLVASALVLPTPGEILLTDHEYSAMHWCWERAAQRQGLTLRTFPLPILPAAPQEIVAAARAAFTPRTRLLFFSHVLSPTGMILPARELCAAARHAGILSVVDGAHAPAFVPLALDDIAADFYGGNCHKWLLAPSGAGFLYLGQGNEDRLCPLQVSWGWKRGPGDRDARDAFGSTPRLRHLEFEGTRDICPWLSVPAAIDFQDSLGWPAIRQRIGELTRYACLRLEEVGLPCVTPTHPELHHAMLSFRLPGHVDAESLRAWLWQERIEVPIIERPTGLLLRTSTHFYNTEAEVDQLARVLPGLLSKG
jgi:isopenicillin-N epimerase